MSNIGLCGAHRTGKTELAIALSQRLNIPFVSINTSDIFATHHVLPDESMDFRTRLGLQHEILNHAVKVWFDVDSPSFICDRTPIDMMAYTLADVRGDTLTSSLEQELEAYLTLCRGVTEKYFNRLILVPPDIPIVKAFGKASCSKGFIAHVHYLCRGLWDEAMVQGYAIEKGATELDRRVADVVRWYEQTNNL